MDIKNITKLVSSIVICQLAGVIGSFFTFPSITTWYAALEKPSFNPPNWLFSPVWITLFILMGISLYLVWSQGTKTKYVKIALTLFGIQLALNILWSLIFFGLKSPFFAFIEIVILWVAILATIFKFSKISKTASYLLIPYILWVSFAAVLNFSIWVINL
ncbi:MAG: tryptophan-rich sensory protein [Methanocellales archaeon]|nr:tryptophan-rich sensory protein [Methanocellales archaeon]